jgi:hypothetical protein
MSTAPQNRINRIRHQMVHAIMIYDQQQSKKHGFNRYALPQYLARVQMVMDNIIAGADVREAIMAGFLGRLLSRILKAVGEGDFKAEELPNTMCYTPARTK